MRFKKYLKEEQEFLDGLEISEKIKPAKDTDFGKLGRKFENIFSRACEIVGLKFKRNSFTGRIWDIHPIGKGWEKILSNEDVNIKTGGTKWMFSSSELYKMLPWDKKPKDFNEKKATTKVKRMLNKLGVADTIFLKPINGNIQSQITNAVRNEDKEKLDKLMTKENFYAEKLGNDYKIRILTNKKRVTSIAIDKGGHVFMRSERPRPLGSGHTMTVTFRTPSKKLGKEKRRVKKL